MDESSREILPAMLQAATDFVGHAYMATVSAAGADLQPRSKPSPPMGRDIAQRLISVRSSLLFVDLPEHATMEIASCARVRRFLPDEPLFIQGQPVIALILLQSGCVKHTQVGRTGAEVLMRFSVKGDIVNIHAESPSSYHTCSAHAMEECRALLWDYRRIDSFLARYPQLGENISHLLSLQLEELEERFREMATEKVARRLSLVLLRLLHQIGVPSERGIRISVNREELAEMTGSTISTVSRLLSEWSEQGFVVPRREAVVISHPERLVGRDSHAHVSMGLS